MSPRSRSHATASHSATYAPVIAAVRVPPSACSTSQSSVIVRSPSARRSTQARSARPISRWISSVRPPCLPRAASRSLRVCVARGSMPYSAVTQPSPLPRRNAGAFASTLAVQSTRVSPNATRTEPSAWRVKRRSIRTSRSWSGARPLGRAGRVMACPAGSGRLDYHSPSTPRALPMIRSMTAFAACERAATGGTLACELRSVNHRFHELAVRLPEELRAIEPALRERVSQKLSRGKIDLVLRFRPSAGGRSELKMNHALVSQLATVARYVDGAFPGVRTDFIELLRYPGVVEEDALDQGGLQADALALLDATLGEFVGAREREGEKLAVVMRERIDGIERIVTQVREWLPQIRAALRGKLDAKLADLKLPLDPGRLEQEVVLNLQKIDVDEELDRLGSHVAEARRVFTLPEAVGRRLDFLMQEFNREANTLGSKSVDARTTQAAVELKVLIEQLREQVQNLE